MADRSERFAQGWGRWLVTACALLAVAGGLTMGIDDVFTVFDPASSAATFLDVHTFTAVIYLAAFAMLGRAFLRADERLPWVFMGTGLLCWAAGNTWFNYVLDLDDLPPYSVADVGFIAMYALFFPGLLLLMHRDGRGRLSVDALIGALVTAAVATAIVLPAVAEQFGTSTFENAILVIYPMGDVLLMATATAVLVATGGRISRTWAVLLVGLIVFTVSDCYFLYMSAQDAYSYGSLWDDGWTIGAGIMGLSALPGRRRVREVQQAGIGTILAQAAFSFVAIGLLVLHGYRQLSTVAIALAVISLAVALLRLVTVLNANRYLLRKAEFSSVTDDLTGLGNRRRLLHDLEVAYTVGDRRVLALFDLNNFKRYNDTYGHPAGDELLRRLARRLQDAAKVSGTAYRLGGDEFCVLLDADRRDEVELAMGRCAEALCEHGAGFDISAAGGSVQLPSDAPDPSSCLKYADQRMYKDKASSRRSALRSVELFASERDERFVAVSELCDRVADDLELDDVVRMRLRDAVRVHSAGRAAIPQGILSKAPNLNESDLRYLQQHPIVAERLASLDPDLAPCAPIVRASHEWWDGTGYPDRLAGAGIPVEARILHACDCVVSLIAANDDPARHLEERSGTQFDPWVVQSLRKCLDKHEAGVPALDVVPAFAASQATESSPAVSPA